MKNPVSTRNAVSLTELLFVLSMCTLVLSMSGVLLQRVMRIESTSRAFTDSERSCTRLSHQLRDDIHQAVSAELVSVTTAEGVFVRLQQLNEVSVEYGRKADRLQRTIRKANEIVARDEFIIPRFATVAIRRLQAPDRIVLLIAPPSLAAATDADRQLQSYRAIPVGVEIEATLRQLPATSAQREQGS